MVNTQKLLELIRERGVRQGTLADALGIKQSSLSLKIHNKRPFYVTEAIKLGEILNISDEDFGKYFFSDEVA